MECRYVLGVDNVSDVNGSLLSFDVVAEYLSCLSWESFKQRTPVLVYLSLVSVLGVLGNLLIMGIYWVYIPLSPTRIFILSMSILDFVTSSVGLPLQILSIRYAYDSYSLAFCRTMFTFATLPTQASSIMLVAIALDRLHRVWWPLGKHLSHECAVKISLALTFSIGVIFSVFIPMYGTHSYPSEVPHLKVKMCWVYDAYRDTPYQSAYAKVVGVFFYCSISVIGLSYYLIGIVIFHTSVRRKPLYQSTADIQTHTIKRSVVSQPVIPPLSPSLIDEDKEQVLSNAGDMIHDVQVEPSAAVSFFVSKDLHKENRKINTDSINMDFDGEKSTHVDPVGNDQRFQMVSSAPSQIRNDSTISETSLPLHSLVLTAAMSRLFEAAQDPQPSDTQLGLTPKDSQENSESAVSPKHTGGQCKQFKAGQNADNEAEDKQTHNPPHHHKPPSAQVLQKEEAHDTPHHHNLQSAQVLQKEEAHSTPHHRKPPSAQVLQKEEAHSTPHHRKPPCAQVLQKEEAHSTPHHRKPPCAQVLQKEEAHSTPHHREPPSAQVLQKEEAHSTPHHRKPPCAQVLQKEEAHSTPHHRKPPSAQVLQGEEVTVNTQEVEGKPKSTAAQQTRHSAEPTSAQTSQQKGIHSRNATSSKRGKHVGQPDIPKLTLENIRSLPPKDQQELDSPSKGIQPDRHRRSLFSLRSASMISSFMSLDRQGKFYRSVSKCPSCLMENSLMITLTIVYVISWMPHLIVREACTEAINLCSKFTDCGMDNFYATALRSYYLGAATNVFVYSLTCTSFRRSCLQLGKKYCV